jgi:hypothetical protein
MRNIFSGAGFHWRNLELRAGEDRTKWADLASRLEITARCWATGAVQESIRSKPGTAALAWRLASRAAYYRDLWGQAIKGDSPVLPTAYSTELSQEENATMTDLLRDVIANPFRPLVVDPNWLSWNDGTVSKLAQTIDAEQAFAQLPVLADALEEAGCTEAILLHHCRGPGPHTRGCWAVDLLLGRVL